MEGRGRTRSIHSKKSAPFKIDKKCDSDGLKLMTCTETREREDDTKKTLRETRMTEKKNRTGAKSNNNNDK